MPVLGTVLNSSEIRSGAYKKYYNRYGKKYGDYYGAYYGGDTTEKKSRYKRIIITFLQIV